MNAAKLLDVRDPDFQARMFLAACARRKLPEPVPEWRFAAPRRWRFDWAFIGAKVALECEGGVWTGGRHTRGKGFLADLEKYNCATALGWRVIRCTPQTLCSSVTLDLLRDLITVPRPI